MIVFIFVWWLFEIVSLWCVVEDRMRVEFIEVVVKI